jgi:hypothetical protein
MAFSFPESWRLVSRLSLFGSRSGPTRGSVPRSFGVFNYTTSSDSGQASNATPKRHVLSVYRNTHFCRKLDDLSASGIATRQSDDWKRPGPIRGDSIHLLSDQLPTTLDRLLICAAVSTLKRPRGVRRYRLKQVLGQAHSPGSSHSPLPEASPHSRAPRGRASRSAAKP